MSSVPLTSLSHGAGCGCKLGAADLRAVAAGLGAVSDPDVLVGFSTSDDAAVYRVSGDLAIVQTIDFFTPIVDDPFDFGWIAAANAMSDVWAMGARPVTALNVVAFPLARLGVEVLGEILRGGQEAVAAAGGSVVGGHSIDDPEPKYGLAVTGIVAVSEVLTNAGGREGDLLVLSKPVGGGVVSTAVKLGLADSRVARAARDVMAQLNAGASEAARAAGAHALTDVTGFGLLGHVHELALASGLAAEIVADDVPAIPGVMELLGSFGERVLSGGSRRNSDDAAGWAVFGEGVGVQRRAIVCDAMTSGGLLAAVPAAGADVAAGVVVGRLVAGELGTISVA